MNNNDPSWLSIIVKFLSEFLSEAHAKEFLNYWHRVQRYCGANDELLPILHLLGYLNSFTVKLILCLAETNSQMAQLRQQMKTDSVILNASVADLRKQAAETCLSAKRASDAAEKAAASRLPWKKLLGFIATVVLGMGMILTVGFLLLARMLPATTRSAEEYQYELNLLSKEVADRDDLINQDRLIRAQMIQQLNALQSEHNGTAYPPGSEGGFQVPAGN
jgi:hypothetical protein